MTIMMMSFVTSVLGLRWAMIAHFIYIYEIDNLQDWLLNHPESYFGHLGPSGL